MKKSAFMPVCISLAFIVVCSICNGAEILLHPPESSSFWEKKLSDSNDEERAKAIIECSKGSTKSYPILIRLLSTKNPQLQQSLLQVFCNIVSEQTKTNATDIKTCEEVLEACRKDGSIADHVFFAESAMVLAHCGIMLDSRVHESRMLIEATIQKVDAVASVITELQNASGIENSSASKEASAQNSRRAEICKAAERLLGSGSEESNADVLEDWKRRLLNQDIAARDKAISALVAKRRAAFPLLVRLSQNNDMGLIKTLRLVFVCIVSDWSGQLICSDDELRVVIGQSTVFKGTEWRDFFVDAAMVFWLIGTRNTDLGDYRRQLRDAQMKIETIEFCIKGMYWTAAKSAK